MLGIVEVGGVLGGVLWLFVVSLLQRSRRRRPDGATVVFAAGLGLSYLTLPVVHHLFATPAEFRYISTAGNFFAFDPVLQGAAFGVAGALALGVSALRSLWWRAGREGGAP